MKKKKKQVKYAWQDISLGYSITRQAINNNLYAGALKDSFTEIMPPEQPMEDTRDYLEAVASLNDTE